MRRRTTIGTLGASDAQQALRALVAACEATAKSLREQNAALGRVYAARLAFLPPWRRWLAIHVPWLSRRLPPYLRDAA